MEKHVQIFLHRLSVIIFTLATVILISLLLQTPETCISPNTPIKPHHKFPKSSCDYNHREFVPIEKKNKRLWSTADWKKKVASYAQFFSDLGFVKNHSRVICVSAGAGHEVMALRDLGVKDVTGVELADVPPLVSRADPHNLPFFDSVFDVAFSGHFDEALFPERFVGEMERTVRGGGECVLVVDECGDEVVKEIIALFRRSSDTNVTKNSCKNSRGKPTEDDSSSSHGRISPLVLPQSPTSWSLGLQIPLIILPLRRQARLIHTRTRLLRHLAFNN